MDRIRKDHAEGGTKIQNDKHFTFSFVCGFQLQILRCEHTT